MFYSTEGEVFVHSHASPECQKTSGVNTSGRDCTAFIEQVKWAARYVWTHITRERGRSWIQVGWMFDRDG